MPEGHTIHRLARDHTRWFAGQPLTASSPQGRFAHEAATLDGRTFEGADAWGKHLFHRWSGGLVVHVHLGLIGKFRMYKAPMPAPRGQIRLRLEGPERGVHLIGPMVCTLMPARDIDRVTAKLGPDPLRDDADPDDAWARLQRKRVGIGQALMDQSVIAGIGNVYRAEILFKLGIHPQIPCKRIDRDTFDTLWDLTRRELDDGVRLKRIVTVDPAEARVPTKRDLKRGRRTYVYKQRWCTRCGTDVVRYPLAGRTVHMCPTCQPEPLSGVERG